MKVKRVGIAAIIPFYLLSDLKLFQASNTSENKDSLLVERRLAGEIPQYSTHYEVAHYGYDGIDEGGYGKHGGAYTEGKHGGGGHHGGGGKKKGKRANAKLQLNNLLKTTASVQNELMRQGAMQMKLANQLEQQRLFRPPHKSTHTHYHYDSEDSSSSEDDYDYPYPPPSKAPYHPPPQGKTGNSFKLFESMPVIDLTHLDFPNKRGDMSHKSDKKHKKKKGLFGGKHETESPSLPLLPLEPLVVPQKLVVQQTTETDKHEHHHHYPPPPHHHPHPHQHPHPPVPAHGHGSKGGYAVPELYEMPSSKSGGYAPVKNADAYYKSLGNPYSV